MTKKWVIYKIESPTGNIYIGKTCDFSRRMRSYRNRCEPKQKLLYRSVKKYGFDKHTISIIEENLKSEHQANKKEKFWISKYKSNQSKWRNGIGLNLTDGGDGTSGSKHIRTDEMKERNRELRIKQSGIAVVQYDLEGNVIKEFAAKRLVTIELGISRTTLKNILNNNTSYTYLPYTFKRKGEAFIPSGVKKRVRGSTINRTSNSTTLIERYGKPILQYSLAGDFIKEHQSITFAKRDTGMAKCSIYRNLNGNPAKEHKFIFRYKPEKPKVETNE